MALKQEEEDNFRKMKYLKNLLFRVRVYFRRFWRCLNAYQSGKNYSHVLQLFFSHLCKADLSSH